MKMTVFNIEMFPRIADQNIANIAGINTERCIFTFNTARRLQMVASSGQRICEVTESVLDYLVRREGKAKLKQPRKRNYGSSKAESLHKPLDMIWSSEHHTTIFFHECNPVSTKE